MRSDLMLIQLFPDPGTGGGPVLPGMRQFAWH